MWILAYTKQSVTILVRYTNLRKVREIKGLQKSTAYLIRNIIVRLIFLQSFDFTALIKL